MKSLLLLPPILAVAIACALASAPTACTLVSTRDMPAPDAGATPATIETPLIPPTS